MLLVPNWSVYEQIIDVRKQSLRVVKVFTILQKEPTFYLFILHNHFYKTLTSDYLLYTLLHLNNLIIIIIIIFI